MTSPQEERKSFFSSDFPAKLICLFVFLFWSFILIRKYINFGYDDWDLAFFNQSTWGLLKGRPDSSIFGIHFFGNHSNLISFLILPIYALAPHALTLVFLKVTSLIAGGYLFYKIILDKLGERLGLYLLFLYLFYPPNVFGILYDFDYESLSPVFLFAMYYFYQKDRYLPFLITALLTMTIKENMPLIVLAIGLLSFFTKRDKIRWAVVPSVLAIAAFYYLTSVFIPQFRQTETHGYMAYYAQFGSTPMEIILNILLKPWTIVHILLEPQNLRLMFDWFSPVLFLNLPAVVPMFMASPIMLQHLLTQSETTHSIYFQYGISLAPFFLLGLSQTLAFLLKRRILLITKILLITLLALMYVSSYKKHWPALRQRASVHSNELKDYQWQLIRKIPSEEPVTSTFSFMSELSSRRHLYAFYKVYDPIYANPPNSFRTPDFVNTALIDFNNAWLLSQYFATPIEVNERIRRFYEEGGWGMVDSVGDTVLLKKGAPKKLVQKMPFIGSETSQSKEVAVDSKFSLISFQVLQNDVKVNSILPLDLVWRSLEEGKDTYEVVFCFLKDGKIIHSTHHEIGYKIYPTFVWKKNEKIIERYHLYVPELAEGAYILKIIFVNKSLEPASFVQVDSRDPDNILSINLLKFELNK